MPCYYPLDGWRSKKPNDNGRYPITFKRNDAQQDMPLRVPCGKCLGCQTDRAKEWAIRAVHESKKHHHNSFLTLTFQDEFLPSNGSISKRDVQLFMKKLRFGIYPKKISYMACGEYGGILGRPHYHALIFGYDFPDKKELKQSNGKILYNSLELENYWPWGHNFIGDVTYQSAAYVARYTTKKILGPEAEEHYKRVNTQTGEITAIEPEFLLTSRNPAIGRNWVENYHLDLQKGFITNEGAKIGIPKYYMKKYADLDEYNHSRLKSERALAYDSFDPENALDRVRVKEQVFKAKIQSLKRTLEI